LNYTVVKLRRTCLASRARSALPWRLFSKARTYIISG